MRAAEEVDLGSDLKDWERLNDVSLNNCMLFTHRLCRGAFVFSWHRLNDVRRAPCLVRCLHSI